MNYVFKDYHVLTMYCGRFEVYLSSTCGRDFHSVRPSVPDDQRVMNFQRVSSSLSLVTGAIVGQLTLWCWLFASQGLCDLSQESAGHCTHTESWEQRAVIPRLPPPSLPPLLQQIFAAFINYSGQGPQSSVCSSNPRLICFGQIHTIGMPHIPHGFLRTPRRGQPGALRRG